MFWCSDYLPFVAKLIYNLAPPLASLKQFSWGYLRCWLLGLRPKNFHQLKHSSQLLGCDYLSQQSCTALGAPRTGSPGSAVHRISQARILEWVVISSSRWSSWSRDQTHVSCISCIGRQTFHQLNHQGRLWRTVLAIKEITTERLKTFNCEGWGRQELRDQFSISIFTLPCC